MRRNKRYFFIPAIIVLLFLLLIDLKNYLLNGEIFITQGDFFDSISSFIEFPGTLLVTLIVLIVYKNIHNYDFYFMWALALVLNTLFYGLLVYFFFPLIYNYMKDRNNVSKN